MAFGLRGALLVVSDAEVDELRAKDFARRFGQFQAPCGGEARSCVGAARFDSATKSSQSRINFVHD